MEREKMNSSENIEGDATHQKMNSDSNVTQEVSVLNPVLRDGKRVIRKMVVMNTNKLKGLGIETTIKNAMSKLEKDKNDWSLYNTSLTKPTNQSTSQRDAVNPKLVPSRSTIPLLSHIMVTSPKTTIPASSIVVTSPKINHADQTRPEFSKIIVPVTKQVVRQTLVSSNSATSATKHADVVDSKSTIPTVKHVVQPTLMSSKLSIPASKHTETTRVSTSKHTIPLTRHVLQPPVASTTFVKQQHNAIANCFQNAFENSEPLTSSKIKIETHETKDLPILNATSKPSEITQTVASDAKKIKVLSDVSLNDTKAKLLEIDKLSSKNLKLTNVIEGTDKLVNSKTTQPTTQSMPLTTSPLKMVLPTKSSPHQIIKITIPGVPKKSRKGNPDSCDLEMAKEHTDAIWATTNPRTYARDDVKKLLNAKIMNKSRLQEKTIADKVISQNLKDTFVTIPFLAVESRNETGVNLPKEPPATIPFHAVESKKETEVKLPKEAPTTIPFHAFESSKETEVKLPKEPPAMFPFHAVESRKETEVKLSKEPPATFPFHAIESRKKTEVKLSKEPPATFPFHAVDSIKETEIKLAKEPPTTIPFHAVESRKETDVKLSKEPPTTNPFQAVESRKEAEVKLPKEPPATFPFHVVESSRSEGKIKPPVNNVSAPVNHLDAKPIPKALQKDPVEPKPIQRKVAINTGSETLNTYSESSPIENEFYGFTIDEVNKSDADWNTNKSFILKKIDKQTLFTHSVAITNSTDVNNGKESKLINVESANEWILNCETGVLEELTKSVDCNRAEVYNKSSTIESASSSKIAKINADSNLKTEICGSSTVESTSSSKMAQINAGSIANLQTEIPGEVFQTSVCNKAEVSNKSFTEKSTSPKKNIEIKADWISLQPKQQPPLITQVLEVNMSTAQISLPASPVRTAYKKSVLSSSSISPLSIKSIIEDADDEISDIDTVHRRKTNSRAIFKTFENHRKASSTTTDDESELSLSVRPPRPKLRKSRHKQTMEQLKIQQNAHVNLVKRFNHPDSEKNIWNDEMITSFIDGLSNRIDALNVKVKKCFDRALLHESNFENVSDKEVLINVDSVVESLINVDPVATSSIEPVKVNDCSVEVNDVPRCSVIVCESQVPQKSLSKSESMENTDGTIDADGPSKIHKITIQKETFLVTEVEDTIDVHLPAPSITHVKLEKEESPQPCSSINTIHIEKEPELVRRKNNSKRPLEEMLAQYPKHSLVKMLAQYVDEDTLKSVILEHDEQYIMSDSEEPTLDSDSDTDSDSETSNDNVNKIFKTILTIDLCDDDDETVHEDVRHLLNDNSNIDDREKAKDSDSTKQDESRTPKAENKRQNMQSRGIIDNQQMRIKSELPNVPCTLLETIVFQESTVHEDVRHSLNDNSNIDDREKAKDSDSTKKDAPRTPKADNESEIMQSREIIDNQPMRLKSELPRISRALSETFVLEESTVQEDVRHLLNDNSNIYDREKANDSDSIKNDAPRTQKADNKLEYIKSREIIDNQNDKTSIPLSVPKNSSVESEKSKVASNQINVFPVEKAVETAAISTNSLLSQKECTRSGSCSELASFIPMEIANSSSRDTGSNSLHDFGESASLTEFHNKSDDDEVNNRPSDVTRNDDLQRTNQVKEVDASIESLKLNIPEARLLGQISNGLMPKDSKNESLKTNISVKKKSFDDALTEADYILINKKNKRKSVLSDEQFKESDINQQKSYKNLKLSEISSESKSLIDQSSGSNKSLKSVGQPKKEFFGKISLKSSADMLEKCDQNTKVSEKESAEMLVNSDPNTKLTSIDKTEIELEKESSPDNKSIEPVSTVLVPTTSNIPKSSSSRKRKLDKSVEVVSTAESIKMEDRPIPKRPKFEYFQSPEILTTKRARKLKYYADCETSDDIKPSENRSVRQSARQPIRRSNVFHNTVDTIPLPDVESQMKLSNDITEAPSSTLNSELKDDEKLKKRSARQPTRKPNSKSKVSKKTVGTEGETKFETDFGSHPPLVSERVIKSSKSSFFSETSSTNVRKRKNQSARQLKRKPNRKTNVSNEIVDNAVSDPSISEPDAQLDLPVSNYFTAVNEKPEYSAQSKVDLIPLKTDSSKKTSELVPMKSASLSETGDPDVNFTLNSEPNVTSDIPQSGGIVEKSSSTKVEKQDNSTEETKHLIPSITGRGRKPQELAPVKVAALYTCGNCKVEVRGKEWKKHLISHYGLAWRTGIDPSYDLENTNSMAQRIIYFTKKEKIRFLKCKKCGVQKKSALGYLSHTEMCGLTDEEFKSKLVKCEYCPKVVRSCSVRAHESSCAGLKQLWAEEKASKQSESMPKEDSYNDQGRIVRQSAKKALTSFKEIGKAPEAKVEDYVQRAVKVHNKQQRKWMQLLKNNVSIDCVRMGCSFTAEDMPTMLQHFKTCVLIDGETFYCSRCDHGPDNRNIIEEHIKANHTLGVIEAINDEDFSDSDDDAEVGEESEESEGESGDNESLEKDFEQTDEFDDDDDDGWNAKGYKKKRVRDISHNEATINNCLDRKVLNEHATLLRSYSSGPYFQPSLEWTQDFRDKHFSTIELFPFAMPNKYSVLNSYLADAYTPKVLESNKFFTKEVRKYNKQFGSTKVNNNTDQWMILKKFEAIKQDDSIIFFTGGPILSMAWLPVPDDHTLSQILAVCCRNDPNEHILLNDSIQTKCLIQIWNFNNLKNNQLRHAQAPQLLYSIAYDYGPVIQMEFCPSGGFTEDRLGLLAVSTCDGHVDLLALPKNITCDNSIASDLIFVIQPSLVLCCDLNEPLGVLITKLVWSQSKGHTKLAAGYSNGMVAIWNLKNVESPNICNRINGTLKLLPTDMFFAAHKCIRLLEFHHDENNEARWLVVGSHDRKVRFYDTHNVFLEISTAVAHSRIVAGCWPMHWTTFLIGIDNAYSFKIAGIIVKQPLDIGCRTGTFYSCIGSTCDISFNNWLNSYVFVSSYGDIYVQYIRQMISGFTDIRTQRFIIGYTDMVNIEKIGFSEKYAAVAEDITEDVNEPQPSTSAAVNCQESDKIYYPTTNGIVFCDFDTPLPAITSPTYEKIRAPPMDTFNMVKVNKILFNPNVSAYKLYALGYESGFVRIKQLKRKQL